VSDIELLPLTTSRLTLRAMRATDAPTLAAYRDDPEVARFQDWPLPFGIEAARSLIAEQAGIRGPRAADWVQIAIDHAGELVGDVAVGLDGTGRLAMIGYTLRVDRQGRGYATEAVGAVIDGMLTAGVHRVAATLDPANIPSAMLLERLGFRYEGLAVRAAFVRGAWEDDDRYAILADERAAWLSRPRTPPSVVRLVELTPANARTVGRLATHHSQERFVAPMSQTFADALVSDVVEGVVVEPWYRAIEADGELVGFLMIAVSTPPGDIPCLWRLLVDRRHQGRGIGSRAVRLLADHVRGLGRPRLDVSWYPGRGSPEPFYRQLGFVPDGRIIDGQHIARLDLS
jgi:RimJ/RimL family protein N-acetyltransferase